MEDSMIETKGRGKRLRLTRCLWLTSFTQMLAIVRISQTPEPLGKSGVHK